MTDEAPEADTTIEDRLIAIEEKLAAPPAPTGSPGVMPPDQFNAMSMDQQVALMEQDKELYLRSLRAAAQTEG